MTNGSLPAFDTEWRICAKAKAKHIIEGRDIRQRERVRHAVHIIIVVCILNHLMTQSELFVKHKSLLT